MSRAKKHPKLSADERAFLNRLDCLNEEEIKQLATREIFAYFKIIDKVDSRADVRRMMAPRKCSSCRRSLAHTTWALAAKA